MTINIKSSINIWVDEQVKEQRDEENFWSSWLFGDNIKLSFSQESVMPFFTSSVSTEEVEKKLLPFKTAACLTKFIQMKLY